MEVDIILAGLISSILTIIISKILDIIQKDREHFNVLRETYFEKKIAAGEAAISQFVTLRSTLTNLAVFYRNLFNVSTQVGSELMQNMMHQFNNQLQTAQSSTFQLSNSIYLYFDLDQGDLFNEEPISFILTKLEQISINHEKYNQFLNAYNQASTQEMEKAIDNELEKISNQINSDLNEISNLMSDGSKTYKKMIEDIRSDMRKFEQNHH